MKGYVTVKFTRRQVEVFLKHFEGFIQSWLEENPRGEELREVCVMERFFQRLKGDQNKMSEKHRCWVTEGYGCPYKIGNRYWDIYKCPYRREDSPCMKRRTK